MGLFGSIFGSFSKSKKLSKLQNIIWGDLGTLGPSGFEAMQESQKAKEKALQEYWDLCEADEGVAQLMKEHSLSRKNLNDLYMKLIKTGVGQWIKGHFVALSALAYYEKYLSHNDTGNMELMYYSQYRASEIRELLHFDFDSQN